MAPGAKWIGCRNMDHGNGTPARYIECMEFFLAPYPIGGGQGDPTKAPDITINSWGCPASEGCSANTLQAAVEAQAAAGIMMVVAAGNSGSACSTVSDPPAIYAASYTVGALTTGTDTIAGFSSRGPVTADGSNRIKPDIAAPGTSTRSCSNTSDTAYTTASGTSMATPHISGAMALLWSAIPSLRHQITNSRNALNNSAVFISSTQCGTAGPPNNVYGWGRIDILAAVTGGSPTPTPTATATATHSNSNSYRYRYSNRYRYIDAKREPNSYSYSHSYTETYTYSESSSVRSASAHTAASNVVIFARATFSRSATGDERSVLTDFAPVRVHAAISRCAAVYERPRPAWCAVVEEMSQNCVDTLLPIQVKGRSTVATWGN